MRCLSGGLQRRADRSSCSYFCIQKCVIDDAANESAVTAQYLLIFGSLVKESGSRTMRF